jgi:hypothetical protein
MSTENTESMGRDKAGTLSPEAVARRRVLLRGVGKGAAVLAATVPLQTLAGQSLLTFDGKHQCSVSGMHSGVHSATPTNTPTCGGYSPGWWGQVENGSNPRKPRRTWPTLPNSWTHNTKCSTVFTKQALSDNPTLFQVMDNPAYADTDERHWICAWLNALSYSWNFPYTGQQVLDYYYSTIAGVSTDALAFFKAYMENHPPP